MTGISSTNFSESLSYNNSPNPKYNGNISRLTWTTLGTIRGYDLVYDPLDRLTSATYGETGSLQTNRNRYSTTYTYDKNGNILTLSRRGLRDGGSYGLVDNLTFTYSGNQVTRIEDSSNDPTYNGAFNFVDGASQTNEYTYDANGNMTKDLNKNISSIQYNLLNLPQSMRFGNGNTADYAYNAAGERLSTSYGNLTSGVTFYNSANYFYTYGSISNILIDGGYITLNGSTPIYHYYLKDHLGSNRVVCNASGSVEQVNHYYPFGGLFGESTNASTQKYKYNGKELDRVHGLDWYDYGARFMDGMRFTTIDPMAEKYYDVSPYAYCGNNPVNAVDPNGNLVIFINGFNWGGEGASPEYWKTKKGNFDKMIMKHFNDGNARYYDGSLGGLFGFPMNLSPLKRSISGYLCGLFEIKDILNQLKRDKNNNILEKIIVVSHSMGGAYAKGFIRAILDYIHTHPEEANGLSISEYDFAPFEPTSQSAYYGVDTYQYSHKNDAIAGDGSIRGAKQMNTSKEEDKGHSLADYTDYINSLPSGNYVFRNGNFIRVQ